MTVKSPSGPRCAALVGSYLSGKTSLMEAMLAAADAVPRKGTIKDGNTVGDSAQEARGRSMSTEVNIAAITYLDEEWALLDCPGSIELMQETLNALMVSDVAVIVVEPLVERAIAVAPLFKFLDDQAIPHMVFINKMDNAQADLRSVMEALQSVSDRPLVLRQVPIVEGDETTGYVDLVSERAYEYRPGEASKLVAIPEGEQDDEQIARQEMLESLADFDDTLLEALLEDTLPPTDEIYQHLTENLRADRIVPVFLGAAERDHGVRRLLKALRHETAESSVRAEALGIDPAGSETAATVFKTYHILHTGKLSVARIWRGTVADGETMNDERISGLHRLMGHQQSKAGKAGAGSVVALGRMDTVKTGDILTPSGKAPDGALPWPGPLHPVYAVAIHAGSRDDEVKMTGALARLMEEDPSLSLDHSPETREMVLWGQGEVQLLIAAEKLKNRFNLTVTTSRPRVPYKETIKKAVSQHARHKKQSGGHGQFGDVHVDIKPLPRGSGFSFDQSISGGSVPRQYIPSVESGVRDYLERGPLGFEVVDVSVTLTDGQYHAVDSSDMAFKNAGRMAMREGLPKCGPVLLEPILEVKVRTPGHYTANIQRLFSGRRGQILGFEPKEGWKGWDEVAAYLPQSEMFDMIVELRSLTQGVGSFDWRFDHLQELQGRLADEIVAAQSAA
ncbi:MAG: elongation factor G [Proteobacteria bacterium]|nr:elongation factor G [Pseudomonadota bacterium]